MSDRKHRVTKPKTEDEELELSDHELISHFHHAKMKVDHAKKELEKHQKLHDAFKDPMKAVALEQIHIATVDIKRFEHVGQVPNELVAMLAKWEETAEHCGATKVEIKSVKKEAEVEWHDPKHNLKTRHRMY